MSTADLQDAVQYLLLGLGGYLVVAYAIGTAVPPLEIGVFLLGVVAIVIVGHRLMTD